MRLIDADALKEGIKELKQSPWYNNDINPSWRQGIKDAVHVVETLCIDEEPTVDAVPVIRCRDCKWYEQDIGCDWGVCFHDDWTHRDVGHGVDGDGYCYRAEKK